MLELGPAELWHRIESGRAGAPKAPKVEGRMSLAVPCMTLIARGGDKDRTEPVCHREDPGEFDIAGHVLADLRAGHTLDRTVQDLFVRRRARSKYIAPREGEAEHQQDKIPQLHDRLDLGPTKIMT